MSGFVPTTFDAPVIDKIFVFSVIFSSISKMEFAYLHLYKDILILHQSSLQLVAMELN